LKHAHVTYFDSHEAPDSLSSAQNVFRKRIDNQELVYFYGAEDGHAFVLSIGQSNKRLVVSGHLPYPIYTPNRAWNFLRFTEYAPDNGGRRFLIGYTLNRQIIDNLPTKYYFVWTKQHAQWFDSADEMYAQTKAGIDVWHAANDGM
jgi:hypothetical protein